LLKERSHCCFFCQLNIASVGLTEAQTREKYPDINIYQTRFTPIKNTLSGLDEKL
jgi:glutathione reductase (NADPH)